jgi:hypothetical protein
MTVSAVAKSVRWMSRSDHRVGCSKRLSNRSCRSRRPWLRAEDRVHSDRDSANVASGLEVARHELESALAVSDSNDEQQELPRVVEIPPWRCGGTFLVHVARAL